MTPVPMAVDTALARPESVLPSDDPRLQGRRVVAYLGTMDPVRRIDLLFDMLLRVRAEMPEVLLVLAGDTEDVPHRAWLQQEITRMGLEQHVLWLGWRPAAEAWRYVRAAEIGLSPFPRSWLLDSCSPTKAVEYMALGLPVVANDNPDQQQVIEDSAAGLCVQLDGAAWAEAVVALLRDPQRAREMGERGRAYVARERDYAQMARMVAGVYQQLLGAPAAARAA
jgi:glycosyltransferase involved in cell wall biosynthesis